MKPPPPTEIAAAFSRRLRALLGARFRSARSNSKKKPSFVCIGVQKGGTTTLYDVLRGHPEVLLSDTKEVHYFSNNFACGENWYLSHFDRAAGCSIRGEITPYYIFHPAAPERIRRFNPQMKLILLLRDPVDRAVSHYYHARRQGFETLDFDDALAAEEERLEGSEPALFEPGAKHYSHQHHSYIARSRYEVQISRYMKLFPAKQILILRSEDFFSGPSGVLHQITAFLGIRPFDNSLVVPKSNAGRADAASAGAKTLAALREKLQPTYDSIERSFGIEWQRRPSTH